jgi:hypothetical protein
MDEHHREASPDWLDDAPPEAPRGRRSLLLALAVLPWLAVLALLLRPAAPTPITDPLAHELAPAEGDGSPARFPGTAPGTTRAPDDAPDVTSPRDPSAGSHGTGADGTEGEAGTGPTASPVPDAGSVPEEGGWWSTEQRGNWRLAPGDGATAAIATAVGRAWLTEVAPRLEVTGIEPAGARTYAEHLAVEAVERPAAGAAVVTLLAVVLYADAEHTAEVQRVAVPIAETPDGPRPAGSPWRLPAPDLTVTPLDASPVDDPPLVLEALEALEAAGFGEGRPLEVTTLERTDGWPWVAHVRISDTEAGADPRWEGSVWLRRHLDGFALSGVPLAVDHAEPAGPNPTRDDQETAP